MDGRYPGACVMRKVKLFDVCRLFGLQGKHHRSLHEVPVRLAVSDSLTLSYHTMSG